MNINTAFPQKFLIKLLAFLSAIVLLLILDGINKQVDYQIENVFYHVKGQAKPDIIKGVKLNFGS